MGGRQVLVGRRCIDRSLLLRYFRHKHLTGISILRLHCHLPVFFRPAVLCFFLIHPHRYIPGEPTGIQAVFVLQRQAGHIAVVQYARLFFACAAGIHHGPFSVRHHPQFIVSRLYRRGRKNKQQNGHRSQHHFPHAYRFLPGVFIYITKMKCLLLQGSCNHFQKICDTGLGKCVPLPPCEKNRKRI